MDDLRELIESQQAAYQAALQEGIRIGRAQQAAAVAELIDALRRIASYDTGLSAIADEMAIIADAALHKHAAPETHDDKEDRVMHVSTNETDLGFDGKPVIR